jgi:hypothetical protein
MFFKPSLVFSFDIVLGVDWMDAIHPSLHAQLEVPEMFNHFPPGHMDTYGFCLPWVSVFRTHQCQVGPDHCLSHSGFCVFPTHGVAQVGFTHSPEPISSGPHHVAPNLEGALLMIYDSSQENFTFVPDIGFLCATMMLH